MLAANEAYLFFQLLRLDSLSFYWNVDSEMYYRSSREQILVNTGNLTLNKLRVYVELANVLLMT